MALWSYEHTLLEPVKLFAELLGKLLFTPPSFWSQRDGWFVFCSPLCSHKIGKSTGTGSYGESSASLISLTLGTTAVLAQMTNGVFEERVRLGCCEGSAADQHPVFYF